MQLFTKFRKYLNQHPLQTLTSQQAYAQWASSYAPTPHNILMEAEHDAILKMMPPLEGQTILDVACGTGRWGQWALANGATSVIGIDDSAAMLKQAKLPTRIQASMIALPLSTMSVDVVLCGLAVGHLPKIAMQQALLEISRVLRPNGVALISDFHPILAWGGAQRTFTAPNGQLYAIEHYIHSYADYFEAATAAALQISGIIEPIHPHTPDPKPLVLVLRLTKTPTIQHNK